MTQTYYYCPQCAADGGTAAGNCDMHTTVPLSAYYKCGKPKWYSCPWGCPATSTPCAHPGARQHVQRMEAGRNLLRMFQAQPPGRTLRKNPLQRQLPRVRHRCSDPLQQALPEARERPGANRCSGRRAAQSRRQVLSALGAGPCLPADQHPSARRVLNPIPRARRPAGDLPAQINGPPRVGCSSIHDARRGRPAMASKVGSFPLEQQLAVETPQLDRVVGHAKPGCSSDQP